MHEQPTTNCTWRLKSVEKIVSKQCHTQSFFSSVQQAEPACFAGCKGGVPNVTDPCWIRGFYSAVMGPDSGKPNGNVTGLPWDQVVQFWEKPFNSEDAQKGGGPALHSFDA